MSNRDILTHIAAGVGGAVIGWLAHCAYEAYAFKKAVGECKPVLYDYEKEYIESDISATMAAYESIKPSIHEVAKAAGIDPDAEEAEYISEEEGYIHYHNDHMQCEIISDDDAAINDGDYSTIVVFFDEATNQMFESGAKESWDDWQSYIPDEFMSHFGYLSGEANSLFVRNHKFRIIYEIVRIVT